MRWGFHRFCWFLYLVFLLWYVTPHFPSTSMPYPLLSYLLAKSVLSLLQSQLCRSTCFSTCRKLIGMIFVGIHEFRSPHPQSETLPYRFVGDKLPKSVNMVIIHFPCATFWWIYRIFLQKKRCCACWKISVFVMKVKQKEFLLKKWGKVQQWLYGKTSFSCLRFGPPLVLNDKSHFHCGILPQMFMHFRYVRAYCLVI